MAHFVIRPAGDPDWANARFLSGTPPMTAVDAATLGIAMGADYEIGRLGDLATFQVTDVPAAMAAPTLTVGVGLLDVALPADPADGGTAITGRDLRHRTGAGTWTTITGIASPHALIGLPGDTAFEVQVRAVNGNGPAPWSASASATTLSAGDTTGPVVNAISYDPQSQIVSTDITEESGAATLVWATADPGAAPVFSVGAGWSGAVHETGSLPVTAGGDSGLISITETTPSGTRELTVYFFDADNNMSPVERLSVAITHAPPPVTSLYDFSSADAADWATNFNASVSNTPQKFSVAVSGAASTRFALRMDNQFAMSGDASFTVTFQIYSTVAETVFLTAAGNSALTTGPVSGPSVQLSTSSSAPTTVTITRTRAAGSQFWVGMTRPFSAGQTLHVVATQCSIVEV